jgi:hypothetical protein
MSNRREQRLRRKAARKALAALPSLKQQLATAQALQPIALAAITYVNEIDAPNLREPYSIDNRRRELVALVHTFLGQAPERRAGRHAETPKVQGSGHVSLVRAEGAGGHGGGGNLQQRAGDGGGPGVAQRVGGSGEQHHHARATRGGGSLNDRAKLTRELDNKKREHRLAAQKFGAMANAKINRSRLSQLSLEQHEKKVADLATALHEAARAMVRAEQALEDFVVSQRASGLCREAS